MYKAKQNKTNAKVIHNRWIGFLGQRERKVYIPVTIFQIENQEVKKFF